MASDQILQDLNHGDAKYPESALQAAREQPEERTRDDANQYANCRPALAP